MNRNNKKFLSKREESIHGVSSLWLKHVHNPMLRKSGVQDPKKIFMKIFEEHAIRSDNAVEELRSICRSGRWGKQNGVEFIVWIIALPKEAMTGHSRVRKD
jgi:hypothetical protein